MVAEHWHYVSSVLYTQKIEAKHESWLLPKKGTRGWKFIPTSLKELMKPVSLIFF